jgi:metal-sulfur cluster biosynthetic enzyme
MDDAAHTSAGVLPFRATNLAPAVPDVSPPQFLRAPIERAALGALRSVPDPELRLDVVSLGLIYDVRVAGDRVRVDMTLTRRGCRVSEQLAVDVAAAVARAVPGYHIVDVHVVGDPPWTPARLSREARRKLGCGADGVLAEEPRRLPRLDVGRSRRVTVRRDQSARPDGGDRWRGLPGRGDLQPHRKR